MRCGNPECRTESDYLRGGSLYWIDAQPTDREVTKGHFIWLCGPCSAEFAVETWRPPGQQLRRLRSADLRIPAQSADSAAAEYLERETG